MKPYYSNLNDRYQQLVDQGLISHDAAQMKALQALDTLVQALQEQRPRYALVQTRHSPVKGLYLWGRVGRGKTFLLDLFVSCLDSNRCLRQHFHHFMAAVHRQLRELSGQKEPLRQIAKNLSRQYQVLCFDEFFVTDIGDAMLLGRLMQFLFEFNVTLVTTSNIEPTQLYRDGLQRSRFLPAIEALLKYTETIHLDGNQDHRERRLHTSQIYFTYQNDAEAEALLQSLSQRFDLPKPYPTSGAFLENTLSERGYSKDTPTIDILGREIPFLSRQQNIICFEFSQLCEGPRSHLDYIEIGKMFTTVIVVNIPHLSSRAYEQIKARGTEDGSEGSGQTGERQVVLGRRDNETRRFIALVDELYDRRVNLLVTAAAPLEQLYTHGSLVFEFDRTRSRLLEMGSEEYLQQAVR